MIGLDLAVLGNCSFSALVDRRTCILWSCVPRFESDPIFCGLLNGEDGAEGGAGREWGRGEAGDDRREQTDAGGRVEDGQRADARRQGDRQEDAETAARDGGRSAGSGWPALGGRGLSTPGSGDFRPAPHGPADDHDTGWPVASISSAPSCPALHR